MGAMKFLALRNPNEQWLIDLILLFMPSTAPLETRCFVHDRIPSRCERSVRTNFRPPDPEEKNLIPITAEWRWELGFHPGTSRVGFGRPSGEPVAGSGASRFGRPSRLARRGAGRK